MSVTRLRRPWQDEKLLESLGASQVDRPKRAKEVRAYYRHEGEQGSDK